MTLSETRTPASRRSFFVIEPSDFANEVNLTAFATKEDATEYAEDCAGRCVDFDGLVDKAERVSKAEGETTDRTVEDYEQDAESWIQGLYESEIDATDSE